MTTALSLLLILIPLNILLIKKIRVASQSISLQNTQNLNYSITPIPLSTEVPIPTTIPTPIPTKKPLKIIFGIGSEAGPAMDYKIVKEAPVHMLSSWYNGPSDLVWMAEQKNDAIARVYAKKYIVHLITWTDLPEINLDTPHGPACGRAYPVSTQVVDDMRSLARIFKGNGLVYVSLFTEFPDYTCVDNNWKGNENYWNTLKDNYRKIKDIFHSEIPGSKVSLSWGGWMSRYDDKENQGGRSLFPFFADVMKESDFISFQSMESDTNMGVIKDMTRILGSYGRPVMLAHYKPGNESSAVFDNDMRSLFTDELLGELSKNGLFAVSFMDNELLEKSEASFQLVKNGIIKYGR